MRRMEAKRTNAGALGQHDEALGLIGPPAERGHHQHAAIPILNVGGWTSACISQKTKGGLK